jgi:serpin B
LNIAEHLDFTVATHRILGADGRQLCWSPVSLASALGLAAEGAAGATRSELVTLIARGAESGLHDHAARLASACQPLDSDRAKLAVSNTLWVRADVPIEDSYRDRVRGWPGGQVRSAPFRKTPEAARDLINADVAETTHDLIKDLLAAGSVTADTVATLVNALYLRTGWRHAFRAADTAPRPFHCPAGTRPVPTMRLTERLGFAARDGWQVIELPADGGVTATVLLPEEPLADAEPGLDARRLAGLLDVPRRTMIDLSIPRFAVRSRFDLRRPLVELGVRELFTERADLSGITTAERIHVSGAVHEAVLRIDESGLEGAAATALVMRTAMAVPDQPRPVVVDRPFLLLVRHVRSGAICFVARVVDPS